MGAVRCVGALDGWAPGRPSGRVGASRAERGRGLEHAHARVGRAARSSRPLPRRRRRRPSAWRSARSPAPPALWNVPAPPRLPIELTQAVEAAFRRAERNLEHERRATETAEKAAAAAEKKLEKCVRCRGGGAGPGRSRVPRPHRLRAGLGSPAARGALPRRPGWRTAAGAGKPMPLTSDYPPCCACFFCAQGEGACGAGRGAGQGAGGAREAEGGRWDGAYIRHGFGWHAGGCGQERAKRKMGRGGCGPGARDQAARVAAAWWGADGCVALPAPRAQPLVCIAQAHRPPTLTCPRPCRP